jgi:hypothetical protein
VFAWADAAEAEAVRDAMVAAFTGAGLSCDAWVSTIDGGGACVVEA